jgi:hypothetical protein
MEAQPGVTPVPQLISRLTVRRYWPMGLMILLMAGCWIPYFLVNPSHQLAPAWRTESEVISGREYANEIVELDGKTFNKCHFENVKLIYHGLGVTTCIECSFAGKIYVGSDSPAIRQFMILDRNFQGKFFERVGTVDTDGKGNIIPNP